MPFVGVKHGVSRGWNAQLFLPEETSSFLPDAQGMLEGSCEKKTTDKAWGYAPTLLGTNISTPQKKARNDFPNFPFGRIGLQLVPKLRIWLMPGRETCKDPRSKCLGKTIRGDLWVWSGKTPNWFSCVMRGFQLCVNMSWAEMWIWVLQKSAESQQRCSSIIYLSIAYLACRFRVLHRLELVNTPSLRSQSSQKSPARRRVPRALRFAVRVAGGFCGSFRPAECADGVRSLAKG